MLSLNSIKFPMLFVATITLFTACTTKIMYNYLDWIAEWYATDLVTLNDEQDWLLNDAVKSELAWHRKHQLPFYIESLEELEKNIQAGLSQDHLKKFYTIHEHGWVELKHRLAPTISRLLKTLSDGQINELEKNLKDQENDLAEKYVNKPADELITERSERMVDKIEDWTGSLNKQQIQLIQNWSLKVKPVSKTWIETRKQWQTNLIHILRYNRDNPDYNNLMKDLFYKSRKFWPDWYHDAYYQNVDMTLAMFANLTNQLTYKQQQRLLNKIDALKIQFIELYDEQ